MSAAHTHEWTAGQKYNASRDLARNGQWRSKSMADYALRSSGRGQLLQIATELLQSDSRWIAVEPDFEFTIGSGPGIRTLNLAVNSRLLYR